MIKFFLYIEKTLTAVVLYAMLTVKEGARMIQRKGYLQKLIATREKQIIKVVTGVRRCGKSTLFSLYIDYLKGTGVEDGQIVYINLEDIAFESLCEHRALYAYISEHLCPDKYWTAAELQFGYRYRMKNLCDRLLYFSVTILAYWC